MLYVINMNFSFFNFQQIPQLNYKFKGLAVSPQRMTLLVKIMRTIVGKIFFTLINVSEFP